MNQVNVYTATDDLETVAPASQDTDIEFLEGVLSWTNGPGAKRIVVASRSPITFVPFNSVNYPTGEYMSDTEKVVYRGSDDSVDLNNILDLSQLWYFRVFAFNGVASNEKYNRDVLETAGQDEGIFDFTLDETFE